jgi:hypothetical protein
MRLRGALMHALSSLVRRCVAVPCGFLAIHDRGEPISRRSAAVVPA